MKKVFKILLKAGVVVGLLYFLSQKGLLSVQETKRAFSQWQNISVAFAILIGCGLLGAVRWQWLLQAQGIRLHWKRTLELTLVGNFFNIALPGAVSGDFVKAFYIGKDVPGQRARGFGSILFDRIAGLSALVLVSGVAMPFGFASLTAGADPRDASVLHAIGPFMTFVAVGAIVFYGYLFLVREHHDPLLRLLKALEKKTSKAGSITRTYVGLRHYHHHRGTVLKAFLLSAAIHCMVGFAFVNLAVALGETHLSMAGIYVLFPLGLLITAIPVAPAGVGTGHAAFAGLFHLLGSGRGADVFTLYALAQLTLGAIGGIVYLRFRSQGQVSPDEAATSEPQAAT